ncbi:SUN domain-containing protein 1 [Ctenodactylus gundi]
MDFSRLHTYTPPQCVPENTGYTYALSSSYSSDALDFETEHKLDPVFDSPRMSRRSLRLITTSYSSGGTQATDADSSVSQAASLKGRATRTTRQRKGMSKPAFSINHLSGKATLSGASLQGAVPLRPPVLDESLIREQTKVDHFWGLDDDSDPKGGSKAAPQGNGEAGSDMVASNGYTCSDCSLLAERSAALTALTALPAARPASRIYSRDTDPKRGASLCVERTLWLAKYTSSSLSSLLVQLFQVVLMKLSYDSGRYKLKSYESKGCESESSKSKSHESKGDDCQGKKHLEAHTAARWQLSRPHSLAGAVGHLCARAGRAEAPLWRWSVLLQQRPLCPKKCHVTMQLLRRAGAAGWSVSRPVGSLLWLAAVAPGKAASGALWRLGIGWYQFATLMSWLNVFLLTRCLRNICRCLILLTLLLLLLGAGLYLWSWGGFLSLLPVLNWTDMRLAQRVASPQDAPPPGLSELQLPPQADKARWWPQHSDLGQQVAAFSAQCHNHEEKLREVMAVLQKLQMRVDQTDDNREGLSLRVKDMVGQHLRDMNTAGLLGSETDSMTYRDEHEVRLSNLEDLLRKLTEKSEAIREQMQQAQQKASSGVEEQPLLSRVQQLELELGLLQSQLTGWQHPKASCEKVDAQVRESLQLMFSEDQRGGALEWLLQKLSSRCVSKQDVQALLQGLELQMLGNITQHLVAPGQGPTPEAVVSASPGAEITGITEAQARVIVNNALKLYSQDKTGMVDFALESGGGSILSTRCSETYETKTALLSLFGIPLWYFSQSPRVVIQPDIYPGNCWAFRGSQGYLVVRLSMRIYPTTFTMEHIPKTLSPTGSISSAPQDFAVYGLENEYQEEGRLLGQFTYEQEGESLQMFHVQGESSGAYQIVELRVVSNWGHPEYTCLYRFRVHGQPAQ